MGVLVADQRIEAVRFRVEHDFYPRGRVPALWLDGGFRKHGEAFYLAEMEKITLRRAYRAAQPRSRVGDVDGVLREIDQARARAHYEEYQSINDRLIPSDPVYSGVRAAITLATTTDLWTLTATGSAMQLRILEHYIGGESTVSTVLRFAIQRAGTVGVTATNATPEKFSTRSVAAAATFATTWSTQPVLTGIAVIIHAFNTFGGTDRWVSAPGEEVYLVNPGTAEQICGRSASGTPVVTGMNVWEEL